MHPKIPRREIARLTAQAFGFTRDDLNGMSRDADVCRARFAAWLLIKFYWHGHELSRPAEIAAVVGGNRDRTTILHGQAKAARFLFTDHDFQLRIREARRSISAYKPPEWAQDAIKCSALVKLGPTQETPPAVVSVALSDVPKFGSYDDWFRQSCLNSEQRFLAIAGYFHPERVRVPQKEAAE